MDKWSGPDISEVFFLLGELSYMTYFFTCNAFVTVAWILNVLRLGMENILKLRLKTS